MSFFKVFGETVLALELSRNAWNPKNLKKTCVDKRFLVRQSWHWSSLEMPEIPKTLKKHCFCFHVFGKTILALEAPWGLKKCPKMPPPPFQKKMMVPPPPPSTKRNHKFHWKSSPRCSEGYICEAGPMMGPLKYYSTSTIVLMSIGPIIKWSKRMPPRRQRIQRASPIRWRQTRVHRVHWFNCRFACGPW